VYIIDRLARRRQSAACFVLAGVLAKPRKSPLGGGSRRPSVGEMKRFRQRKSAFKSKTLEEPAQDFS
jgi:hypothetical protein